MVVTHTTSGVRHSFIFVILSNVEDAILRCVRFMFFVMPVKHCYAVDKFFVRQVPFSSVSLIFPKIPIFFYFPPLFPDPILSAY